MRVSLRNLAAVLALSPLLFGWGAEELDAGHKLLYGPEGGRALSEQAIKDAGISADYFAAHYVPTGGQSDCWIEPPSCDGWTKAQVEWNVTVPEWEGQGVVGARKVVVVYLEPAANGAPKVKSIFPPGLHEIHPAPVAPILEFLDACAPRDEGEKDNFSYCELSGATGDVCVERNSDVGSEEYWMNAKVNIETGEGTCKQLSSETGHGGVPVSDASGAKQPTADSGSSGCTSAQAGAVIAPLLLFALLPGSRRRHAA